MSMKAAALLLVLCVSVLGVVSVSASKVWPDPDRPCYITVWWCMPRDNPGWPAKCWRFVIPCGVDVPPLCPGPKGPVPCPVYPDGR